MYCLMMKAAVKPNFKLKTFNSESYSCLREKEIFLNKSKFYQKLFVVLLSMATILIFSESPRELENICENYNSRKLCNVW